MLIALYLLLAVFIGMLAAMFGLGGGFLIVPVLTLAGVPIHHAVGTSSFIIVFSSLSAIVGYSRQKKIEYGTGIMLAIPSIVGAYLGAYATVFIDAHVLKIIFAFVLVIVAVKMAKNNESVRVRINKKVIPFGGFVAGIASGLLGVGGGIINVPFLSYTGLSIHSAVATSSFSIFFSSFTASIKHFLLGNIEPLWAAIFIPGIIIGAQIGARVAVKIKAKNLKTAFAVFLIILAILMILRA